MKTTYYHFLATVANATSPAVRILTTAEKPSDAFASAAIALSNFGFVVTQMSALTHEQFQFAGAAPMAYEVKIQPAL